MCTCLSRLFSQPMIEIGTSLLAASPPTSIALSRGLAPVATESKQSSMSNAPTATCQPLPDRGVSSSTVSKNLARGCGARHQTRAIQCRRHPKPPRLHTAPNLAAKCWACWALGNWDTGLADRRGPMGQIGLYQSRHKRRHATCLSHAGPRSACVAPPAGSRSGWGWGLPS